MQKTILTPETIDSILSKYADGDSINNIVKTTGVLRRVVERTLKENGLNISTKSQMIQLKIPELNDRDALYQLYYVENLTIEQIAIKLQTNSQVVKNAFKRLNIEVLDPSVKRRRTQVPKDLQDPAILRKLYEDDQESVSSIAKRYDVSDSLVRNALKINNITLRTLQEQQDCRVRTQDQILSAKIARRLRSRTSIAVKNGQKAGSAVKDLGCSIDDFKAYIEAKFYPHPDTGEEMTWDNYSYSGWHFDHIVPLDKFDLSDPEQFKRAAHYTNIQPLWARQNFIKSNKDFVDKVDLYIVCGASGSGKSYVCERLSDKLSYVSHDKVPKEEHYYHLNEFAKQGKNILYDPWRKPIAFVKRYAHRFNMYLCVIIEDESIIIDRIKTRGGKPNLNSIRDALDRSHRWAKDAQFVGTSSEVLEHIQQCLERKTNEHI